MSDQSVLVIGAGVGGLSTAALLLKAGFKVTVLEGQSYPGGCAGTFFYKGYRFDAGATLAGGFGPNGPHTRLAERVGLEWPIRAADPAWTVHLPDNQAVTQYADPGQWEAEWRTNFPGRAAARFWRAQARLADIAWETSSRPFPWPPTSGKEFTTLVKAFRPAMLRAGLAPLRSIGSYLPDDPTLRTFVDAQLLISAQATADEANALYGSAALDLPRRGVNHVRGGIGSLARTMVDWIRENGGEVLYRQEVTAIKTKGTRAHSVQTARGDEFSADWVVGNLTPWSLDQLLGSASPQKLRKQVDGAQATWGAFTLYLVLKQEIVEMLFPPGAADHHQIIVDAAKPLGEGNSVFLSIGDEDERAPKGFRTATVSTHTAVKKWWDLRYGASEAAYLEERARYQEMLIRAIESRLRGFEQAIHLCLPGTPVTFEFYTGRSQGMVGGFPQTSLFKARGPRTGLNNLLLVGDSIFPGQSTAGVTLGAFRVADYVMAESPKRSLRIKRPQTQP